MTSPGFATFRCRGAAVAPLVPLVLIGLWSAKPAVASMCTEDNLPPIQLAQAASPSQGLTPQLATHVAPALGLKFDPLLNLEPPQTGQTPVYVFGRRITGQMEDVMQSEGDAEFRKLGLFIKGDSIRHDMVRDELFAEGSVKLFREGEFYEGPKLRLKLGTTQGFFDQVSYQLTTTGGRGTADRAEFIQPLETKLVKPTYTTCLRDRPAWELRASEIMLNMASEVGQAKSAYLFWGGVPLPFGDISFPLGSARKSGFLTPSLSSSSRGGLEVTTPYYWNIAPHHDITFFPTLMSRRGPQLGSELRFLQSGGSGTVFYETLPNDRVTGEDRSFGSVLAGARVNPQLSFGLNVARASDSKYLADFGGSILGASKRALPGEISTNLFFEKWTFLAIAREYQLLQSAVAPVIAPYNSMPSISASRKQLGSSTRGETLPLDWSINAEAVSFRHPSLAEGERYTVEASLAYPQKYERFSLISKASLHGTYYTKQRDGSNDQTLQKYSQTQNQIDRSLYVNNGSDSINSYTRVIPTFNVEANTVLERDLRVANFLGEQTLEPKLSYVYTPFKAQSKYPVFDTTPAGSSLLQIFSDSLFNGSDRVPNRNYLTGSLTTRLLENGSGGERLRGSIGQRVYLEPQRVFLPGIPSQTDPKSDILTGLSVRLTSFLDIDAQTQYAVSKSEILNGSLLGRYVAGPAKSASLAYRFSRDRFHSIDLALQMPLNSSWYVVGRYNYALKNIGSSFKNEPPGLVQAVTGLEYDGKCWVGRIVAHRYVSDLGPNNAILFFQVELNGLGRVGTNPLPTLTRSITNYQDLSQIKPLPAKFDNFQ